MGHSPQKSGIHTDSEKVLVLGGAREASLKASKAGQCQQRNGANPYKQHRE
jgi:hypothetical protein